MNPTQRDIQMMRELGMIPEDDTKEHQLEEVRNDKAFISNDIVNALFQSSTVTSFKIMFYLARVESNIETGEQLKITLNLKDLLDYTRIRKETLDENVKKLQQTLVTFYNKENKRFFTRVQLLGKAEYAEDDKSLFIWIDRDIYSRLKETQKAHTEFNASDIMKLSQHKHSIRILMLLTYIQGFTTEKTKTYTLDQLNYMFDTEYANYSEFCRKVLDKAREELINNGLMTFDYVRAIDKEYLSKGRKPIKYIRINPIAPEYKEPNIYAYIQDKQLNSPKQKTTKENDIEQQIREAIDVDMFPDDKRDFYVERLLEFIEYCVEKNKQYKNWNTSFSRHVNGYIKNMKNNDPRV